MQFLKNILNHYILEHNVYLYLLAIIGLTTLLWLISSFWQPKLNQLGESKFFPQKDWYLFLLIGFISFILFALHACIYGLPFPINHDEYCYVLMGKTFAEGRLTNPSHPLRQFFDNFHLLNEPTYTAKYPPAQAAFLAIGIILFNHPIVGVWLSGAIAAIACFWMLRAFFSQHWSFFGTLLSLTHTSIFNWNYGYNYGNPALLGGLLCIGALFRIVKTAKTKDAVIFAVGIAILTNSRPFEGSLVCLPFAAVIIYWIIKHFREPKFTRQLLYKFVVPVSLVLLLNFVWMAYYNQCVTYDALKLPYSLYTRQYDPVPLFLPLLSPLPPAVADQTARDQMVEEFLKNQNARNPIMKDFHINEIDAHYIPILKELSANSYNMAPFFLSKRAAKNLMEFLNINLAVYVGILLLGGYVFRSNKKYLFFTAAFFFCLLLEGAATYNQSHYFAPFIPFLIVAITAPLAMADRKIKGDSGRRLMFSFALTLIIIQFSWLFFYSDIPHRRVEGLKNKMQAVLQQDFDNLPGKHLVVLNFSSGNHEASDGRWIFITLRAFYNEPDIDQSKVVWANNMGEENNRYLFNYFNDRHVWVLGYERTDPWLQPKILSCEGRASNYQPNAQLEIELRSFCPKQKE